MFSIMITMGAYMFYLWSYEKNIVNSKYISVHIKTKCVLKTFGNGDCKWLSISSMKGIVRQIKLNYMTFNVILYHNRIQNIIGKERIDVLTLVCRIHLKRTFWKCDHFSL